MTLNLVILALVTMERLFELWLARRNTRHLVRKGAREHAAGHYPLIVGVHALWLASLWWLAPTREVHAFWLSIFLLLELARVWVLVSLGRRWTTRIIILPDVPLVQRGPYRFVNHPNYWVVIGEIAVLPLVFGLWLTAGVFTFLNGMILLVRIREENRALGR